LEFSGSFFFTWQIIEFFNKIEPLGSLTLALVLLTAYYAIITHRMLRAQNKTIEEMRTERDLSIMPRLRTDYSLRRENEEFYVKFKNFGRGPALGLRLQVRDEVTNQIATLEGTYLEDPFFELEPGEEREFILSFPENLQSRTIICFDLSYEDLLGKVKESSTRKVYN